MMEKFSQTIAMIMFKRGHIEETQIDDIRFALEVVFSNCASFFTILFLGVMLNQLIKTLLFFGIFIGFRLVRDRYHAKTFLKCYLLTVGAYLACLGVSMLTAPFNQVRFVVYFSLFSALIYLILEKQEIERTGRNMNVPFTIAIFTYIVSCLILSLSFPSSNWVFTSVLGTIVVLTTMIPSKHTDSESVSAI